jgi:hypothetical protein
VTGQAIGWWQFDDERTTLTSTLTGQSVRYIAAAVPEGCRTFTNSGNRRWLRFEYQDRYTHYPLLIEWRNVPLCGRPLVWRVDHERSAQLWRYMTNADVPHPAYGLWRRVDDCVIDAFACWPSNSSVGHYPTCVALNAGWTNGAWTTRFYRAAWANRGHLPVALDQDSPLIPSLDAPAPAPWLHIVPGGDNDGDRQGLQPSAPESALVTRNLERLVHTLPHLMSADHVRFLIGLPRREGFDSQVHTHPATHKARLLFADDEIITDVFIAHLGRTSGREPITWSVRRTEDGSAIGLRRRADGLPLLPIRTRDRLFVHTQPPHWATLRLAQSLIDARLRIPSSESI